MKRYVGSIYGRANAPEPGYAQLPPRDSANRVVAVYDALVSQDGWKVKRDADKERQALAQSKQESTDERYQRLTNTNTH